MFSSLHWHDVNTPLLISAWLFFIIMARIQITKKNLFILVFHRSHVLAKIFPESALLIVLGLIVGLILDELWVLDIYLHPDLFFLYLLPPIALDAGYFLPNNAFFLNFGTILLYAVLGTLFNIVTIASIIYAFLPLYQWSLPFIDILLFSTLISAVDPVAVLSVFEEIHVNQLLYICVFGESLLNDAVTIVSYYFFSKKSSGTVDFPFVSAECHRSILIILMLIICLIIISSSHKCYLCILDNYPFIDYLLIISCININYFSLLALISYFAKKAKRKANILTVLYHSLASMAKIGSENLIREDFVHALINFAMVSTGGVLIGLVWVCITAFATKFVLFHFFHLFYESYTLFSFSLSPHMYCTYHFAFLKCSTI
ncbi:sodium/hydrogen exchanger 3 domain protein [Necator americanus]|uniref:Sodium/hydrogen exchanger 3 domain protein n=1 Tax=Necator americanus TaxID=51031 RepID=W2TH98_NECAM|nr:sodium/hydrogen exchanger 3 domain protein [Necator americanus]ETN81430.1 sodium/hydrogen exchanger 3 domain protein [Necator americanus]